MRTKLTVFITAVILLFSLGCQPDGGSGALLRSRPGSLYGYTARQVRIMGLTEIGGDPDNPYKAKLRAYVDLLDAFGSRIKSAGIFRFELYEFLPRSSQRKGKRLATWPDIDLTDAKTNNIYWRDFLRAYQFDLDIPFAPSARQSFILEVTCITPTGKRLTNTSQL